MWDKPTRRKSALSWWSWMGKVRSRLVSEGQPVIVVWLDVIYQRLVGRLKK